MKLAFTCQGLGLVSTVEKKLGIKNADQMDCAELLFTTFVKGQSNVQATFEVVGWDMRIQLQGDEREAVIASVKRFQEVLGFESVAP
jgi:hypothetical protein